MGQSESYTPQVPSFSTVVIDIVFMRVAFVTVYSIIAWVSPLLKLAPEILISRSVAIPCALQWPGGVALFSFFPVTVTRQDSHLQSSKTIFFCTEKVVSATVRITTDRSRCTTRLMIQDRRSKISSTNYWRQCVFFSALTLLSSMTTDDARLAFGY